MRTNVGPEKHAEIYMMVLFIDSLARLLARILQLRRASVSLAKPLCAIFVFLGCFLQKYVSTWKMLLLVSMYLYNN